MNIVVLVISTLVSEIMCVCIRVRKSCYCPQQYVF